MRICSVCSESAWENLVYILTNGITGRVFENVLMRGSHLPADGDGATSVYAGLEGFLTHLVAVALADARRLLVH